MHCTRGAEWRTGWQKARDLDKSAELVLCRLLHECGCCNALDAAALFDQWLSALSLGRNQLSCRAQDVLRLKVGSAIGRVRDSDITTLQGCVSTLVTSDASG